MRGFTVFPTNGATGVFCGRYQHAHLSRTGTVLYPLKRVLFQRPCRLITQEQADCMNTLECMSWMNHALSQIKRTSLNSFAVVDDCRSLLSWALTSG